MATFTVTNTNDSGAGSLRQAILDANDISTNPGADNITFADDLTGQTILLTGGELSITDDLTIDGDLDNDGIPDITIDGNQQSRIFNVDDGDTIANQNVTVEGLEITGGNATTTDDLGFADGGGIRSVENLTVRNSIVSGNSMTGDYGRGGGIFSAYGSLIVNNSTISNNSLGENSVSGVSIGYGGGIFSSGELVVRDSTISGNSNTGVNIIHGGGIFAGSSDDLEISEGDVEISGSVISDNSTYLIASYDTSSGGGIFSSKNLTISDSTINGNSSLGFGGSGGGIAMDFETSLTVSRSTVSGNSARGREAVGGGIASRHSGNLTVRDSTISKNVANGENSSSGGGIYGGNVALDNSTISSNSSVSFRTIGSYSSGGGIAGGTVMVSNSTIRDNLVSGFATSSGGGIDGNTVTVSNSTVSGNSSTTTYSGAYRAISKGGGIAGETVTVTSSTVSGNSSTADGSPFYGIASQGGGIAGITVTVSDSTVSGNASVADGTFVDRIVSQGGGIAGSAVTVSNSTVDGNSNATVNIAQDSIARYAYGGGIFSGSLYYMSFNNEAIQLTVSSSTVSNNSNNGDKSDGGGIFVRNTYDPNLVSTISNSTISGNSTDRYGGGFYNGAGGVCISNSTFTDNRSPENQGSGVASSGDATTQTEVVSSIIAGNGNSDVDVVGGDTNSFVSQGNNLIGTGNAIEAFTETSDLIGVTDPGLEPLADNGGPTQTHALQSDSQAIDAGSNPDSLATDQRGPGFDRVVNGQADIGAFEVQTAASNAFFFSADGDTTVGNITVADEDIILFDGTDFSLFFDGSDVLSSSAEISAFDVISDTEILLSFDKALTIEGVGFVDDSDVVKFTAESLGRGNTAGSFELYLDGSDLGLTRGSEDIDALTRMADGSLVFSTKGNAQLSNGIKSRDEDLLRINPATEEISLYFDGSDVELTDGGEDIDAVGMREGQLLLSTVGNFSVGDLSEKDEDAFSFTPSSLGRETSGSFGDELFFDGSEFGFTGDLSGIDFVG